jgi:hypothetical protein
MKMKYVLVASLVAALGLSISGVAQAHGYGPAVGGSFYWADSGYVVGINYGGPYAVPYYDPPRYRSSYRGHRYGHRHGYRKGYKKGYRKGYRKGRRHGYRDDRYRYYGDH